MIKIALHENVFKSASLVYFNADKLQWIIDELPDQAFLNTAEWKILIPQLYKLYPNDDMNLNVSVTSPPVIEVSDQDLVLPLSQI
uniref:Lipid-binding serum glycoprotein C-terminal domain-containing protein n=1 Tax=Lotus japonicus TaxID=34305 RepID=I3SIC8_LOTJA|nr:unknown [Lotus japonicus]